MEKDNLKGLTEKEVEQSRKKYGKNKVEIKEENTFVELLLESLGDPIIKILLIALAIKVLFLFQSFDWYETLGIVIAIFVASFISSISEYGSEKEFVRLQKEASKMKCKVKRNDKWIEIDQEEVVVGDLIYLEQGDKIPADGYIVKGTLSIDESTLNGEAKEVIKKENTTDNLIYKGTTVYNLNGYMRVTEIGESTMYGRITKEMQEKQADSPLKLRLRNLAQIISKIGYVASVLVSISYLFSVVVLKNNFDITLIKETITNFPLMFSHILYALTLSVTIIVVAVPEGLPMMITLVLSSNMKRMLKDQVLVRKLVGIETAGSLNILFTDKTGTLTKGKLEVIGLLDAEKNEYHDELSLKHYPKFQEIIRKSMICNNASTYNGEEVIGGNITDRAILSFFKDNPKEYSKILKQIPFDSKNKYAITKIELNGRKLNLVKGSPEKILPKCSFYYNQLGQKKLLRNKDQIEKIIEKETKKGIRVLVMATCENEILENFSDSAFVAAIFIKDEIRKEALEGIKLVKSASIQTVMVTGDNLDTATAIGKELGLIEHSSDIAITSTELNQMTDEEVMKILPRLRIVARSLPKDKSRLVQLAQRMNLVVGMTGDGVNDALALKKADVGFAMGSGTEVSKEASDIVILDNNFLSIVKAILFGRTVFKSIRKFIIIQLTINLCAISLSIIGPFIHVDTPVTVIQMLWVNMVMDTLAGVAFAYEPPLLEYMNEKPKRKDESILNKYMVSEIFFTGIYSALLCILFLKLPLFRIFFPKERDLMTAFFALFIFIDIFNSLNARTSRLNLLANIIKNKVFIAIMIFIFTVQLCLIYYGGDLFRTYGLTFGEMLITILLAFSVVPVDWIRKLILKRKHSYSGV